MCEPNHFTWGMKEWWGDVVFKRRKPSPSWDPITGPVVTVMNNLANQTSGYTVTFTDVMLKGMKP